jgi:subtilisin family serine protease
MTAVDASSVTEIENVRSFVQTEIGVRMDPRLQYVVAKRRRGLLAEATASTEVDEIAVIAKVSDVAAWERLSEVRVGAKISGTDQGETYIVTGRIPAVRIAAVRAQPFVKSLKAAQPLRPALAASIDETNARPSKLPPSTLSGGGQGVVVGIVDYGCDFAHRNFLTAGRTRLMSLWHQGGTNTPGSPFGYGREYSAAEINAALTQESPYTALGYAPARDTPTSRGTHGTHVMDIAAGSGGGSGVPGFAPQADLIFVDVSHSDIPFDGTDVVGSSFGDSTRLLEAVQYIFDKAGDRPCVVNISLGTNGGPHDGTTLVEEGIDRLLSAKPNRALTIAASNSFDDGVHARGTVPQDGHVDLKWDIPVGDRSSNEFECWYKANDRITLELIDPTGQSFGLIRPDQNGSVPGSEGAVQIFAANRLADPNNNDNMIGVFLARTARAGIWVVRLHGDTITDGAFHAWIERDNVIPSSFAPPHDNQYTIGSISCGRFAVAVGSYDAHKPDQPISWFSSAGPTRDGRQKPEVSGPGHAVFAAHSRTLTGVISKNGTSMAAPAVAGIIALTLAEARARGLNLPVEKIREFLIGTARRNPPAGSGWNDRYGHGRVDASAMVGEVIKLAPNVAPPQPSATAAVSATRRRSTRKAAGSPRKSRQEKTGTASRPTPKRSAKRGRNVRKTR